VATNKRSEKAAGYDSVTNFPTEKLETVFCYRQKKMWYVFLCLQHQLSSTQLAVSYLMHIT